MLHYFLFQWRFLMITLMVQYDEKLGLRFKHWQVEHFLFRWLLVESFFMVIPVLNFWIFIKFSLEVNLLILSFSISTGMLKLHTLKWNVEQLILHYTIYMLIIHHFGKTKLPCLSKNLVHMRGWKIVSRLVISLCVPLCVQYGTKEEEFYQP